MIEFFKDDTLLPLFSTRINGQRKKRRDDFIQCVKTFEIRNPIWFLATLAYESLDFTCTIENGEYSAHRLLLVFRKYFKNIDEASLFEYKPDKIFNRVYANRMGNGDEKSKEGSKYKGRGYIQLTGKDNYTRFIKWAKDKLHIPFKHNHVSRAPLNMISSGWYWKYGARMDVDYAKDFKSVCVLVNGGLNGYGKRMARVNQIKRLLIERGANFDKSIHPSNISKKQ